MSTLRHTVLLHLQAVLSLLASPASQCPHCSPDGRATCSLGLGTMTIKAYRPPWMLQVDGVPSSLGQGEEKITGYKSCSVHEAKSSPRLGEGTAMLAPLRGDSREMAATHLMSHMAPLLEAVSCKTPLCAPMPISMLRSLHQYFSGPCAGHDIQRGEGFQLG